MSRRGVILIVDDDTSLRTMLTEMLADEGHEVVSAADGREALAIVENRAVDLVILDLRLPDTTGLALLPRLKEMRPEASVIMLTALGAIPDAVEAMRLGADNFVPKPVEPAGLFAIVERGLEAAMLRKRSQRFARMAATPNSSLLGDSEEMREVLRLAESVAPRETTVLILGPTGSGKGKLARFVHERSLRASEPFVELNCAGLSRELTESELFGHERGAFTGAVEKKLGLFEVADGGSLFLDEIGEMDPSVQMKLLKVLEEKRFRRVGGTVEQRADVRVIAATHRDLTALVQAGRFRQDLYYRMHVFALTLPPLWERPEDIIPLAIHFLRQFRPVADAARAIDEEVVSLMLAYSWPGNVRELRNVMERAAIVAPPGSPILTHHLPPLPEAVSVPLAPVAGSSPGPVAPAPPATMEEAERSLLEHALSGRQGSLRALARALGISRATLYRKARKYGIPLEPGD